MPISSGFEDRLYRLLGEKVRTRRRALGRTQTDLAAALGLTRTSIANIEAGEQRPPLHHIARLADELACELHDLVPDLDELSSASPLDSLTLHYSADLERSDAGASRATAAAAAERYLKQLHASHFSPVPVAPAENE